MGNGIFIAHDILFHRILPLVPCEIHKLMRVSKNLYAIILQYLVISTSKMDKVLTYRDFVLRSSLSGGYVYGVDKWISIKLAKIRHWKNSYPLQSPIQKDRIYLPYCDRNELDLTNKYIFRDRAKHWDTLTGNKWYTHGTDRKIEISYIFFHLQNGTVPCEFSIDGNVIKKLKRLIESATTGEISEYQLSDSYKTSEECILYVLGLLCTFNPSCYDSSTFDIKAFKCSEIVWILQECYDICPTLRSKIKVLFQLIISGDFKDDDIYHSDFGEFYWDVIKKTHNLNAALYMLNYDITEHLIEYILMWTWKYDEKKTIINTAIKLKRYDVLICLEQTGIVDIFIDYIFHKLLKENQIQDWHPEYFYHILGKFNGDNKKLKKYIFEYYEVYDDPEVFNRFTIDFLDIFKQCKKFNVKFFNGPFEYRYLIENNIPVAAINFLTFYGLVNNFKESTNHPVANIFWNLKNGEMYEICGIKIDNLKELMGIYMVFNVLNKIGIVLDNWNEHEPFIVHDDRRAGLVHVVNINGLISIYPFINDDVTFIIGIFVEKYKEMGKNIDTTLKHVKCMDDC